MAALALPPHLTFRFSCCACPPAMDPNHQTAGTCVDVPFCCLLFYTCYRFRLSGFTFTPVAFLSCGTVAAQRGGLDGRAAAGTVSATLCCTSAPSAHMSLSTRLPRCPWWRVQTFARLLCWFIVHCLHISLKHYLLYSCAFLLWAGWAAASARAVAAAGTTSFVTYCSGADGGRCGTGRCV